MKGKQKKLMLKIIIIFIAILIVDIFAPFLTSNANVFAAIAEWVGKAIFESISKFLVQIGDIVISALQKIAIGSDTIINPINNDKYIIRYSPGIIFSGGIPMFDINFISPREDYKVQEYLTYDYEQTIFCTLDSLGLGMEGNKNPGLLVGRNTNNINDLYISMVHSHGRNNI